jgi:hypothetical protein
MLNKKKLFILISAVILVIILFFVARKLIDNRSTGLVGANITLNESSNFTPPEFMNEAEKAKFNLPTDSKIQVLKRNAVGETEVYRVIRKDTDIILDPSRIGDPDMIQPEK